MTGWLTQNTFCILSFVKRPSSRRTFQSAVITGVHTTYVLCYALLHGTQVLSSPTYNLCPPKQSAHLITCSWVSCAAPWRVHWRWDVSIQEEAVCSVSNTVTLHTGSHEWLFKEAPCLLWNYGEQYGLTLPCLLLFFFLLLKLDFFHTLCWFWYPLPLLFPAFPTFPPILIHTLSSSL